MVALLHPCSRRGGNKRAKFSLAGQNKIAAIRDLRDAGCLQLSQAKDVVEGRDWFLTPAEVEALKRHGTVLFEVAP